MRGNYELKRSFRCTSEMWQYITQQSKNYGITPSEYIRRAIYSYKKSRAGPVYTKEEYLAMKRVIHSNSELQNEVRAIGVNINQIVKNYNSHFYLDHEKKKLFSLMDELLFLVREYTGRQGEWVEHRKREDADIYIDEKYG